MLNYSISLSWKLRVFSTVKFQFFWEISIFICLCNTFIFNSVQSPTPPSTLQYKGFSDSINKWIDAITSATLSSYIAPNNILSTILSIEANPACFII